MALLDDIFLDELVDDPDPVLVDEPEVVTENPDENEDSEQPPLNPSEPSEGAVRVAPKKSGIKRQMVLLNPQKVTGPRGIQCIPQYFKKVKLKGKGHELSDLNTVMSHLEHWANRMYPRSNFDDVLKRLEILGHKRPVMTHLKKIRLGMIEDLEQDSNLVLSDTEAPAPSRTTDDIFDELLSTQPKQHTAPVKEITEAQRQRMLRNRQLAEEKRQARLAAEAAKSALNEHNARNLQAIDFQQTLLETRGDEREAILQSGDIGNASVHVVDASDIRGVKSGGASGSLSQELDLMDVEAWDQVVTESTEKNHVENSEPAGSRDTLSDTLPEHEAVLPINEKSVSQKTKDVEQIASEATETLPSENIEEPMEVN